MKPYISIPLEDYVSQKQYEQAQERIRSLEVDLALARDEIQELLERARVAEENHKYVVECALRERDEARRECRLLLLGQEVLRSVRDLPAPPDDLVTIVPVPRKDDKPCQ